MASGDSKIMLTTAPPRLVQPPQEHPHVSAVYNPQADLMAEIERLELEWRDLRRRLEQAHSDADRDVLNRQLAELADQIARLQAQLG